MKKKKEKKRKIRHPLYKGPDKWSYKHYVSFISDLELEITLIDSIADEMSASPSQSDAQLPPPSESESQISSLVYGKFTSLTASNNFDSKQSAPLQFCAPIKTNRFVKIWLKSCRDFATSSRSNGGHAQGDQVSLNWFLM